MRCAKHRLKARDSCMSSTKSPFLTFSCSVAARQCNALISSEKVQHLFILSFVHYLKWISVKLGADARIGLVLEQQLHDIRVVILDGGNQSRTSCRLELANHQD